VALCSFQWAVWHAFPQYRTDRHLLHSFNLMFPDISAETPHCAHAQSLRAATVDASGLACKCEISPEGAWPGSPDSRCCTSSACEAAVMTIPSGAPLPTMADSKTPPFTPPQRHLSASDKSKTPRLGVLELRT
jgi:hypothetical protein